MDDSRSSSHEQGGQLERRSSDDSVALQLRRRLAFAHWFEGPGLEVSPNRLRWATVVSRVLRKRCATLVATVTYLELVLEIRSEDGIAGKAIADMVADLCGKAPEGRAFSQKPRCIWIVRSRRRDSVASIFADGVLVFSPSNLQGTLAYVSWLVNRSAIDHACSSWHLMHAGVVAQGPKALLLPAPMESGKSTLVAALVIAGMSYLSDELAAITPGGDTVFAFPRAISLSNKSQVALKAMSDQCAKWTPGTMNEFSFSDQYDSQIPASSIRPGCVGYSAEPVAIAFPRFSPGVTCRSTKISPALAAALLVQQTFCEGIDPTRTMQRAATLARRLPAFQLSFSDLREATSEVSAFLQRIVSSATDEGLSSSSMGSIPHEESHNATGVEFDPEETSTSFSPARKDSPDSPGSSSFSRDEQVNGELFQALLAPHQAGQIPRVDRNVPFVEIGDEVMAYDTAASELLVLNGTAASVWLLCCGEENSVAQIVEMIISAYDAAPDEVVQAVLALLTSWHERGLLHLD